MKPVLYVVVNKSLDMSPGKMAAQVGHAVAAILSIHRHPEWITSPQRWLMVLEADNASQMWHLHQYLDDRGIFAYPVIDEGVNEVPPFSLTALAVEVLDKGSPEAEYLSGLSLYSYKDKIEQITQVAFRNGQESRKWRNRFWLFPA